MWGQWGQVGTTGARGLVLTPPDVFVSHPAAGQVHRLEDSPDPGRRQVSCPRVPTGPRFPKASPKPGEGLSCPVLPGTTPASPPSCRMEDQFAALHENPDM